MTTASPGIFIPRFLAPAEVDAFATTNMSFLLPRLPGDPTVF